MTKDVSSLSVGALHVEPLSFSRSARPRYSPWPKARRAPRGRFKETLPRLDAVAAAKPVGGTHSSRRQRSGGSMAQFSGHDLSEAVIQRLAECADPRFADRHDRADPASARFRARRRAERSGMADRDPLSDQAGPGVHRQAPGVHPALGHARGLDPRDAINHRAHGRGGIDGARPVVHRRRAGAAARHGHQQRRRRASPPSTPGAS